MANWDEYYNQDENAVDLPINNENVPVTDEQANEQIEDDGLNYLSDEDLASFIRRLSGINESTGAANAEISYQAYDAGNEKDFDRNNIYQIANAYVRIMRNKRFDDLFLVDIVFKSSEDTELKLFWGRLQRHLRNESESSDKDWIFYINLLERASVTEQTTENDVLLTANIFNPILCYLTRETPNLRVTESEIAGELQGGNIVRMLVPAPLLTFNISDDIDTNEIKGDVLRNEEQARYINSAGM